MSPPSFERRKVGWYGSHVRSYQKVSKEQEEVILLGDSIVEYLSRYPSVWDQHLAPVNAINCGLRGDLTLNVLWRVERLFIPSTCSTGIIHCGVNDINDSHGKAFKPHEIAENVISCGLQLCRKNPLMSVIIMGILPAGQTAWGRNSRIQKVNSLLKKLSAIHGFLFIEQEGNWLSSSGKIN